MDSLCRVFGAPSLVVSGFRVCARTLQGNLVIYPVRPEQMGDKGLLINYSRSYAKCDLRLHLLLVKVIIPGQSLVKASKQ